MVDNSFQERYVKINNSLTIESQSTVAALLQNKKLTAHWGYGLFDRCTASPHGS